MKKRAINKLLLSLLILIPVYACNINWEMPPELLGDWQSGITEITVRTEHKRMQFEFITDTGRVAFSIFQDKTASGNIGTALFEKAEIRRNSGFPSITGVSYIIKCGAISEIFDGDPLNQKEVEIWLSPMRNDQTVQAELRYTEGGAHFPMAGFELKKVKQ